MSRTVVWALGMAVLVTACAAGATSTDGLDDYADDFRFLQDGDWGSADMMGNAMASIRSEMLLLVGGVGWLLTLARPIMTIGAVAALVGVLGARIITGQGGPTYGGRWVAILAATAVLSSAGAIASYLLEPSGQDILAQGRAGQLWQE